MAQVYNQCTVLFQNQVTDGISDVFDIQYDVRFNPIKGIYEDTANGVAHYHKSYFLQLIGDLGAASLTLQFFDSDEARQNNPDFTNDAYWTTTGIEDEKALKKLGTNPSGIGNIGYMIMLATMAPGKYRIVLSGSDASTNFKLNLVQAK
jgi:hypothetical protein